MTTKDAHNDARLLGAHYASGRIARTSFMAVFLVVMVIFFLWRGAISLIPLMLMPIGLGGAGPLPLLRVSSDGVRLPFRRLLPWSEVEAVEEPDRWHDHVWIPRRDGSTVDVPPLTAQHVAGLRRLAGLSQINEGDQR